MKIGRIFPGNDQLLQARNVAIELFETTLDLNVRADLSAKAGTVDLLQRISTGIEVGGDVLYFTPKKFAGDGASRYAQ